jgi:hypothetical protein
MSATAAALLPISIVIPTRNSMDKLPDHLRRHREVFTHCAEIVHCDSYSQDDTKSFLAADLAAHPNLRQIDHPPGLYESWNHALQQCTQPFIYISTVGDRIDLDALKHLLTLATETDADVVISPPRFEDEAGRAQDDLRWPLHQLIATHTIAADGLVPPAVVFTEAVLLAPDGMLGSAASGLFRASFLKPRPFPPGFHGVSDSAWALTHLPEARCAIIPQPISTFLLHPKSYESHGVLNARIAVLIRSLLRKELRRRLQSASSAPLPPALLKSLRHFNLVALLRARHHFKLVSLRKKWRAFWFFHPGAWIARRHRARYQRLARDLAARVRSELARLGASASSS